MESRRTIVWCNRCEKAIEGYRWEDGHTSNFYEIKGIWEKYKKSVSDFFICDSCMKKDIDYIKDFGEA